MLWGLVMQFMAGYFFMHSWSNLFGELLTFADREFYSVSERVFSPPQLPSPASFLPAGLVDLYLLLLLLS